MAATDPSAAHPHELTGWDADDGTEGTDITACIIDDTTTTPCTTIGGAGAECLGCHYSVDPAGLTDSDTISFWHNMASHDFTNLAMLPYTDSNTVATGNKISVTPATSPMVFTLTAGFLGDLADLGGGSFKVRFVEDGGLNGTITANEVDADLTVAGGPGPAPSINRRRVIITSYS